MKRAPHGFLDNDEAAERFSSAGDVHRRLAMVIGHVAMFGAAREADEGTAAHIFQLLMVAQAPIVAFFAAKWMPRAPRQALQVLALQIGAALAALAPVFFLNL